MVIFDLGSLNLLEDHLAQEVHGRLPLQEHLRLRSCVAVSGGVVDGIFAVHQLDGAIAGRSKLADDLVWRIAVARLDHVAAEVQAGWHAGKIHTESLSLADCQGGGLNSEGRDAALGEDTAAGVKR